MTPRAWDVVRAEREVLSTHTFTVRGGALTDAAGEALDPKLLGSSGSVELVDDHVRLQLPPGDETHQGRLSLPSPVRANGVLVRARLRGWDTIRYLAVGYTHDGAFRHVKVPNVAVDRWAQIWFAHGDLAFGLQNDWATPDPAELHDLRIYVRGAPSAAGATIDVGEIGCWLEAEGSSARDRELFFAADTEPCAPDVMAALHAYFRLALPDAAAQARTYLTSGRCPVAGGVSLDWPLAEDRPTQLDTVGTYRYAWHALHPVVALLLYAHDHGAAEAIYAARGLLESWLAASYFQPDPDRKYAWYDHGTAERTLAFLLMLDVGRKVGFDARFMGRLRWALLRHGRLLASDAFYASHQPSRYHNHAWFQDVALLATALLTGRGPLRRHWADIALRRLEDQLEQLVVRDGRFAVLAENSIDYHCGAQRLAAFAGDLARKAGRPSAVPVVAEELERWSAHLRYPDGRFPSHGDTYRRPNPGPASRRRWPAGAAPEAVILPRAGYGVARGNHEGAPYVLAMFATSRCQTHKHQDHLSFTLFLDSVEWLIDPSFHSHEYQSAIPAYLRSAFGHNALAIPDLPYSIEPGLATIEGETDGQRYRFEGEHRAYEGVQVSRRLVGSLDSLDLTIDDEARLAGAGPVAEPRLMLHCGDGVRAALDRSIVHLSHPGSPYQLTITLPRDGAELHFGSAQGDPIRGITGLGFMETAPIHTIECVLPYDTPLRWHIRASTPPE